MIASRGSTVIGIMRAGKTTPSMTLKQILLLPFNVVVAVLILLDEVARPIYRPLARWLGSLRLVERIEARIAGLNRYVILVLLAVPFAVAEPLKVYGVLMLGEGHFVRGVVILALAYLASFLLIERIYHAGRDKLLSIRWFGWIMTQITTIRAALTTWVSLLTWTGFSERPSGFANWSRTRTWSSACRSFSLCASSFRCRSPSRDASGAASETQAWSSRIASARASTDWSRRSTRSQSRSSGFPRASAS